MIFKTKAHYFKSLEVKFKEVFWLKFKTYMWVIPNFTIKLENKAKKFITTHGDLDKMYVGLEKYLMKYVKITEAQRANL